MQAASEVASLGSHREGGTIDDVHSPDPRHGTQTPSPFLPGSLIGHELH